MVRGSSSKSEVFLDPHARATSPVRPQSTSGQGLIPEAIAKAAGGKGRVVRAATGVSSHLDRSSVAESYDEEKQERDPNYSGSDSGDELDHVMYPSQYPPINRDLLVELFWRREFSFSHHCGGLRWMLCCGFGSEMQHVRFCSSYFVHHNVLWLTRTLTSIWCTAVWMSTITHFFNKPYLTNFTFFFTWLYFLIATVYSTGYCLIKLFKQDNAKERIKQVSVVLFFLKLCRLATVFMYEIIITLIIIVDCFYWGVLYWMPSTPPLSAYGLHAHTLNLIWILTEVALNKVPVFFFNVFGTWLFGIMYLCVQVTYWSMTGDPVYEIMNWARPERAVPITFALMVMVLFVHGVVWFIVKVRDVLGIAFNRWLFDIRKKNRDEAIREALSNSEASPRTGDEFRGSVGGSPGGSGGLAGPRPQSIVAGSLPKRISSASGVSDHSAAYSFGAAGSFQNQLGAPGSPLRKVTTANPTATPATGPVPESPRADGLGTSLQQSFVTARSTLTAESLLQQTALNESGGAPAPAPASDQNW